MEKEERNEERKKAKKIKLKVAALNVGTMTSEGREVANLMVQRGWAYCVCRKLAGRGRKQDA